MVDDKDLLEIKMGTNMTDLERMAWSKSGGHEQDTLAGGARKERRGSPRIPCAKERRGSLRIPCNTQRSPERLMEIRRMRELVGDLPNDDFTLDDLVEKGSG